MRSYSLKSLLSIFFVFAFFLVSFGSAFAVTTSPLLPLSDGTFTQFTPKTGSTHYTMVDEITCNGVTDYNHTTIVGERDSYNISLSSIPNGSTITQIDITPCASRQSSGGATPILDVFYRLNGINSLDSGSYNLSGTTPTPLTTTSYSGLSTVKGLSTTLEIGGVLTSGTKGVRLGRIEAVITYTALNAPTNLNAAINSLTQLDLSWTDNASNETGFVIDRSPDGISGWLQVGTTSANITSFQDTGLTPNTLYYYRVYAFNSGGISGYSNIASKTTPFSAPTIITSDATSIASNTATFNSVANSGGSAAAVYYKYGTSLSSCPSLPNGSNGLNLGTGITDQSPNSVVVRNLIPNTTYYFCAFVSGWNGLTYGDVLSFTTLP